ncbi:hypothetical protein [Microbacterium sp. Se63.02b]|uniref:hypothetical protein n=1 Tax=Microbacterium sp. Se63.02b TaxID=2709304 RepID=UPI001FCECAB3|nr:hypothetical protein [Microbacterium sp. Se63.02b]
MPFTGLPAQTQVVRNTLRLCGVSSVRTTRMLGVKGADTATIARWLDRAERLGANDGSRARAPQAIAADAASSSVVATS